MAQQLIWHSRLPLPGEEACELLAAHGHMG